MTYKQWEDELLIHLKDIPDGERQAACEYYREIFNDKFDAGIEENSIIEEFGDPRICADRILSERADTEKKEESAPCDKPPAIEKRRFSISKWVGIFFLTTMVFIPFASVILSVIAAFAAVTLSAGAFIVAGALGTVASPLALTLGYSGLGTLSLAGCCVALFGVGAILLPVFWKITKFCIVSSFKLTKYAIGRCRK